MAGQPASQALLRYGIPLAVLGAVAAATLLARRFYPLSRSARLVMSGIAALPLAISGTLHLVRPDMLLPLLPSWVPERTLVIVLTGLPELAGAAGLFVPRYRRAAGRWLVIMMVAIFPANIYVAGQTVRGLAMPGVLARTAMQSAYILLLVVASHGWPGYRRTADRAFQAETRVTVR